MNSCCDSIIIRTSFCILIYFGLFHFFICSAVSKLRLVADERFGLEIMELDVESTQHFYIIFIPSSHNFIKASVMSPARDMFPFLVIFNFVFQPSKLHQSALPCILVDCNFPCEDIWYRGRPPR